MMPHSKTVLGHLQKLALQRLAAVDMAAPKNARERKTMRSLLEREYLEEPSPDVFRLTEAGRIVAEAHGLVDAPLLRKRFVTLKRHPDAPAMPEPHNPAGMQRELATESVVQKLPLPAPHEQPRKAAPSNDPRELRQLQLVASWVHAGSVETARRALELARGGRTWSEIAHELVDLEAEGGAS